MVNYLGTARDGLFKTAIFGGASGYSARLDREVNLMYAIIENGSKQYRVSEGDVVKFEKLNANVGDKVSFNVLLVSDETGIKVGSDAASFKATGEVLKQDKFRKIIVFKYKAKKQERKKQGHRQPFTAVKIESISAN